jgi:molecular chaperone GrpE
MEEKNEQQRPKLEVVDRRHWVRKDGGNGEGVSQEAETPSILPSYVEKLEARAREQEARLKTFVEEQRAENEAFRERIRKDAERRAEEALAGLVQEMVGVMDDLDRAIASGEAAPAAGANPSALLEGVRMVQNRLHSTLEAQGLERIQGEKTAFDPNVHEAVGVVPVAEPAKENQVVEEVLPGYLLKGRLLRPARVRVGKLTESPSAKPVSGDNRENS